MYRVCLNAAIDITRKEKRQIKPVQLSEVEMPDISYTTDKDNINQEKLYQAISRLSNIDKAIMTLYLDEYSYKEIALIIGITESNTGVKINRIKSEILKLFKNGNG
jgi:RNA polymerase sigma-70 factor (ECF subfamily)